MATTVRVVPRIARLTPRNNILFTNGKYYLHDKHKFRYTNFITVDSHEYIEINIICKLVKKCQR